MLNIHDINVIEVFLHAFAETVESTAVYETAVGDESDDAIRRQPVHCPAIEAGIHIVNFGLLCCTVFDKGILDLPKSIPRWTPPQIRKG